MSGPSGRRASARGVSPQPERFAPVFIETMKDGGLSGRYVRRRSRQTPFHDRKQSRNARRTVRSRAVAARCRAPGYHQCIGLADREARTGRSALMMSKVLKIVGVIVLIIIAIPAGCVLSAGLYQEWFTYTHRYRLTIEVETPAGVRSSSSVIEVSIQEKATWVPQTGGVLTSVRGEAVFVDLGNGRHVIATLGFGPVGTEDKIGWLATETLGPTHASAEARTNGKLWREASSWRGRADLSPANIPTLVTFSDLNDPKTARVVRLDDFEQMFGEGIRFKRAFVEMVPMGTWPFNALGWPSALVGEPVTRGIEKRLPWLPHPRYLSGQFACGPTEPHCLHGGHLMRK